MCQARGDHRASSGDVEAARDPGLSRHGVGREHHLYRVGRVSPIPLLVDISSIRAGLGCRDVRADDVQAGSRGEGARLRRSDAQGLLSLSVVDETNAPQSDFRWSAPKVILALVAIVIALGGWYWIKHRDASPSTVAAAAGASSCDSSGYYIKTTVGGKQTVYDCFMPSGKTICVTYHAGVASDSTVLVRAIFANTLGATTPSCLA